MVKHLPMVSAQWAHQVIVTRRMVAWRKSTYYNLKTSNNLAPYYVADMTTHCSTDLHQNFKNSLIMHKEKTKEINV